MSAYRFCQNSCVIVMSRINQNHPSLAHSSRVFQAHYLCPIRGRGATTHRYGDDTSNGLERELNATENHQDEKHEVVTGTNGSIEELAVMVQASHSFSTDRVKTHFLLYFLLHTHTHTHTHTHIYVCGMRDDQMRIFLRWKQEISLL